MASSSPTFVAAKPAACPVKTLMDLELVYTDRRHDMLWLLLHSGVNVSEAEDVTQQVFLNAYERPIALSGEGSLFPWLVKCARNLAVSRYLVILLSDDNFVLTLMHDKSLDTAGYPKSFHLGFIQPEQKSVLALYERIANLGFSVTKPGFLRGSAFGFYVTPSDGVMVEISIYDSDRRS